MRLLKISIVYPQYLQQFFAKRAELLSKSYSEQKSAMDYDGFSWLWAPAMAELGYEMDQIILNAESLQKAWAKENDLSKDCNNRQIVLAQVKKFKPDILWFDDYDEDLLAMIREEVSSIKLVLGWTGSAIVTSGVLRRADLVLSCAPEAVEYLKGQGIRAEHLHHGFDPTVLNKLEDHGEPLDVIFAGQIARGGAYHQLREEMLEALSKRIDIQIFALIPPESRFKLLIKQQIYDLTRLLKKFGVSETLLNALPGFGKSLEWEQRPKPAVNPNLAPYIYHPVFGLDMFQALKDSKVTVNIHANSSPRFASNMRLWEATGVGTCLVTDWKENMQDLFEIDKEVVTYKTVDECVEKIKWLLDHPKEREAIGKAGKARTLKDHTFAKRALRLDEIIRRELTRKASASQS